MIIFHAVTEEKTGEGFEHTGWKFLDALNKTGVSITTALTVTKFVKLKLYKPRCWHIKPNSHSSSSVSYLAITTRNCDDVHKLLVYLLCYRYEKYETRIDAKVACLQTGVSKQSFFWGEGDICDITHCSLMFTIKKAFKLSTFFKQLIFVLTCQIWFINCTN
jgi:hypothetical protein